ncbi:metalloregulator ArsR/SmtB family transcription factor [Paenibacillus sp.]|uniref:metalloregulator ArsR/SmtB family transcription factor n=1 Tax=Paenibacillus sp. TaxID=58172 RepID=UPI002D60B36C|nr:metalloregulator ArsR/SmtB family transcription factor [Paenibacillus sp.]HZG85618.1 metalloregulator ArsR/SmtB family transcription factor [Paenibacillus sp.]
MHSPPEWKESFYQELSRIGKCFSSPRRLELIDLLAQSPKSVEQLAKLSGMSVANVSQHLQLLYEARLVRFTKKGNYVIYELAGTDVAAVVLSMREAAERRSAEMRLIKERLVRPHDALEAIPLTELKARLDRGEALLVDVRPREEYEAYHIPGAVSIPFDELERHLSSLPADRDIVAYCRGPYCMMSAQAVELLRRRGLRAHRLEEGVLEWRAVMDAEKGGTNDVA